MNRFLTQIIAIFTLALQRVWFARGQYTAVMLGVFVATTIVGSIVLYAEAINAAILQQQLAEAHAEANFDLLIKGDHAQIDAGQHHQMNQVIEQGLQTHIGLPIQHRVRHGWTKPLQIGSANSADPSDKSTRIQFYSDLPRWLTPTAGKLPQPTTDPEAVIEVAASPTLASELGLSVGDTFSIAEKTGAATPMQVQATLVGLIELRQNASELDRLYAPRFLDEALTTTEETFLSVVGLNIVPSNAELTWAITYDETALDIGKVDGILAGLQAFRFALTASLNNTQLLTNLDSTLRTFQTNTFLLRGLLLVLGTPIVAIALYYVGLASRLIVENQRTEIAVLKSRGLPNWQLLALLLLQGWLIVSVATGLAIFAIPIVAQQIGTTTSFLRFEQTQTLPILVRPQLYGYLMLVSFVSLIALIQPGWQATRHTLIQHRQIISREQANSIIHRYYLDLGLVLVGFVGYGLLAQSGSIISQNERGHLTLDPLLILTPILVVAGLSFGAMRLLPQLLAWLAQLVSRSNSLASLLGLRQIARAPSQYQGLILLLTYTLALGLFTATVAATFDRNRTDQVRFATGADYRVREFDSDTGEWFVRPLADYQVTTGVMAASPVRRVRLVGRRAEIQAQGMLLALDPTTFQQVSWWRSDFRPGLDQILALLGQSEQAILADANFIQTHRLQIGDQFEIDVGGERAEFELVGQLGLFPTLYPDEGDHLVARLDYLARLHQAQPTEVWLQTDPAQHQHVKTSLESAAIGLIQFHDGRWGENSGALAQTNALNLVDPLQTGIFGTLSLGFIAAVVLSVLGFLLYAYLGLRQRARQFGLLRATGLSLPQLAMTIAMEQVALVGLAIMLGTLLGGSTGWAFTRFLQLSIVARQTTPPFLITIPWELLGQLYLILLAVVLIALAVAIFFLRRLQIHVSLRLGD